MALDKSSEVYRALQKKGFQKEFCSEIAYKYMNTKFTSDRMLEYLYCCSKPSIEEVVDEMFAIISERDRLVEKYKSEKAQARINEIYRYGL